MKPVPAGEDATKPEDIFLSRGNKENTRVGSKGQRTIPPGKAFEGVEFFGQPHRTDFQNETCWV